MQQAVLFIIEEDDPGHLVRAALKRGTYVLQEWPGGSYEVIKTKDKSVFALGAKVKLPIGT